MGLFHKRYLCIFSLFFILASFVATWLSAGATLAFALIFAMLSVACVIMLIFNKKRRFAFFAILVCSIFVFVGFLNSFLFIGIPKSKAESCVGEHVVVARIDKVEEQSEKSSTYEVRLVQTEEKEVNIKAWLNFSFPTEFSVGDTIIAPAYLEISDGYAGSDASLLLDITVEEDNRADVLYQKSEDKINIKNIFSNMRKGFINYIDSLFEPDSAALLKGFLISDTSDISPKTISDFRRSGVSHLLSVSGLHIALLLGSLDFLLRKLFIPKKIRCVAVVIFGIFFLALTDFAGSAVRSALMLFSVYAGYLFSEDNDAVTSLFASIALILLVSPYSIYDIGLFMSFFATFGLVTVYSYIDLMLPRIKSKRRSLKLLERLYLWLSRTTLITLIANVFLLPILWGVFGELSVASIPANLLLSPISALYLPLGAMSLVLGKIPLLGGAVIKLVSFIGDIIEWIADILARANYGVISLEYHFAPVLIVLFAVATVILMIIKLKHKLLICIPIACFGVVFALCISIFTITAKPTVDYVSRQTSDYVIIQKADSVTVCDVGKGPSNAVGILNEYINSEATEIENYIVTHAHKNHEYSIEKIMRSGFIRRLYLPLTTDSDELANVKEIYDMAREYNTQIIFYDSGELIETVPNIQVIPHFSVSENNNCSSVYIEILNTKTNEKLFTYADCSKSTNALESGAESKYFVLGDHGNINETGENSFEPSNEKAIVFLSKNNAQDSIVAEWKNDKYILSTDENKIINVKLPLK